MKIFKSILSFVLLTLLLAVCGPKPTPFTLHFDNPYAPQPGDSNLMTGDIKIDSSSVSLTESQPPQVMVNFAYFPPTPCYKLRVEVSGPNQQNQISLKAYGVAEKDKPCTLRRWQHPCQPASTWAAFPKDITRCC